MVHGSLTLSGASRLPNNAQPFRLTANSSCSAGKSNARFWSGSRPRAGAAKVIEQLTKDLMTAFPDMKGFSRRDLLHMRSFAEVWPDGDLCRRCLHNCGAIAK